MKKDKLLFYALTIFIPIMLQSCLSEKVTFESLLNEMIDRDRIASFPSPAFSTRQFSSYDRESVSPDSAGWFANSDRTMFIRQEQINERKEQVMMDAEGPGAVVRFWMTFAGKNSGKGIIRIYFDNNRNPVVEGTAFDLLSRGLLVGEPLASSVSDLSVYEMRGHNLYLPLPYQKHCKITYESDNISNSGNKGNSGESVYYNINYRTYKQGTTVTTFNRKIIASGAKTIEFVQQKLKDRSLGIDKTGLQTELINSTLPPGRIWSRSFSGESKAIKSISVKLEAKDLNRALRTTIIEAEFDGENTVWCPVGDFFGTGYQIRFSNTWYSQVAEDGTMRAYWVMPFKNKCIIKIHNTGSEEVKISGDLSLSNWKWDERSMHFGASWHQFTKIFTRSGVSATSLGTPYDINYIELSGEGTYVGDVLTLFNTAYIWWGEGDEKIYVDKKTFPSHFGTGTEDYYGYAWGGRSEKFSNHPFIAQPDATGDSKPGYVVNIRQRALDAIPFKEHFKFDMELWHWQPTYMNYAPTCFYYLKPGGKSNIKHDIEGTQTNVALRSTDIISNMVKEGKVEAEMMAFSNSCGNKRGSMSIGRYGDIKLSDNLHVIWQDGFPGDTITFTFTSPKEGSFDIIAACNQGPGFGSFKCSINNTSILSNIDLSSQERGERKISLGKRLIKKGENTISFEVLDSKRKSHFFALDCLTIK